MAVAPVMMSRHYRAMHPTIEYPMAEIARDRFDHYWTLGANGCHEWAGCKDEDGYGKFYFNNRNHPAHRWAYEQIHGPIPGLVPDHLCRNHGCVNVEHLEAVTNRENLMRGNTRAAANAAKTHCPQQHSYSGDNLYITPSGTRGCKTCMADNLRKFQSDRERANIYKRAWRARRRAEGKAA